MEHIKDENIRQKTETAVTIGNFDGMHRGHRELIKLAKQKAAENGIKSVALTFSPHPMFVFKNRECSALIMSPKEKKYLVEKMGIDVYIEYPFTDKLISMSPEYFAEEILFNSLKSRFIIIGENYKFGYKQTGDVALLKELGAKKGVEVIAIPSVKYDGERVSSTRIRERLAANDIEGANDLLLEPFFVMGEVKRGKRLGRTIGFPTINIYAEPTKLFPPDGVYVTTTLYNGKTYNGVTNIGYNPTVNGDEKMIETNLFGFAEEIYDKKIITYMHHKIRDEIKFPSIDALREQLKNDVLAAKAYFSSNKA